MEKVLPRAMPFEIEPARAIDVSLARNEKESFQILVLPTGRALRKVAVSVSDLQSDAGALFRREHIQCAVVGHVETKARPPYGTSHIGWWPDPILDFLGPVDVAEGDLQSFWIRIRAPKDQAPGLYRGTLAVSAEGCEPRTFPMTVRVRSFAVPTHSPLPLAITFAPHDYPADEKHPLEGEWRNAPEYPVHAWKKHKRAWAEMLADYYIDYDSLYRHGPPDFEVVNHLQQRGQLVAFNYQVSIWNARNPIASGPFTDWDPRSWTTYHGDGSWTCVGPDGTPLPTIRLENFRDGLEDYAYALILEATIRRREASPASLTPAQQEWLASAKEALAVPDTLVKSMTEYSREPARLYAWRNRMAEAIERSGLADVNPWGANFGVRGLRGDTPRGPEAQPR